MKKILLIVVLTCLVFATSVTAFASEGCNLPYTEGKGYEVRMFGKGKIIRRLKIMIVDGKLSLVENGDMLSESGMYGQNSTTQRKFIQQLFKGQVENIHILVGLIRM